MYSACFDEHGCMAGCFAYWTCYAECSGRLEQQTHLQIVSDSGAAFAPGRLVRLPS